MEVRQIRFCFCRGNARGTAWAVSERVAWGRLWKVGFVGSRENVRETARVMSERERRGGGGGCGRFDFFVLKRTLLQIRNKSTEMPREIFI